MDHFKWISDIIKQKRNNNYSTLDDNSDNIFLNDDTNKNSTSNEFIILVKEYTSHILNNLKSFILTDNNLYPFKKGTHMHMFYLYIFPYFKVGLILIFLVIKYFLLRHFINWIFKTHTKEIGFKNQMETITDPQADIKNLENEKVLQLRGRVSRNPRPINYKELFLSLRFWNVKSRG